MTLNAGSHFRSRSYDCMVYVRSVTFLYVRSVALMYVRLVALMYVRSVALMYVRLVALMYVRSVAKGNHRPRGHRRANNGRVM